MSNPIENTLPCAPSMWRRPKLSMRRWPVFLGKLIVAVAIMSAVLLGLMHVMPAWSDGEMLQRFLRLGALVLAGVVAYFGSLMVLGFRVRHFARKAIL